MEEFVVVKSAAAVSPGSIISLLSCRRGKEQRLNLEDSRRASTTITGDWMSKKDKRGSEPVRVVEPVKMSHRRLGKRFYNDELYRLQIELVKMQEWIKKAGLKVVVLFEGRDAAGKGGVIKRIMQRLNPRICQVVALHTPTERETTQWYFQRYVAHLPAAGEIVLFDRSWYNRAGVEKVMSFCTDHEYKEFMRSCPEFERMLVRSGILLIKYWFSVSDEEQERRFKARIDDPTKRWKLSPMDLESRSQWLEYSKAKDVMFAHTDIKQAPWYVVEADNKRLARLNCIRHLLAMIPYEEISAKSIRLPPRQDAVGYIRPPMSDQTFVPNYYPPKPAEST
jgi:polyphosphate kinase 2